MPIAPCPTSDELSAFHLGRLGDVAVDRVADHLDGCTTCEARLRELERQIDPVLVALRADPGTCLASAPPDTDPDLVRLKSVPTDRTENGWTPQSKPSTPIDVPNVPGYEVLRPLGEGGMGVVHLARDVRLDRLVALKGVRLGSERERSRFRAEAEVVARLRHPNLVQIHQVVDAPSSSGGPPVPYLVLEFVDGASLDRLLDGSPWAPRDAAELVETVARAIEHAHSQGVVHRDLKPANVLIASSGPPGGGDSGSRTVLQSAVRDSRSAIKVTDFGVAKRLDVPGETRTGELIGTPRYMAPEQAAGEIDRIGPTTDVWALGAILYELLTGRPPFHGVGVAETLLLVANEDPVPPRRLQPGVPRDLETVCLSCLRKEPVKRYSSAAALADDLRRFLDGRPVVARPIGRAERVSRWCRRNPREALLATLAAFGLVGASVVAIGLARERAARAEQEVLSERERAARSVEAERSVHQAIEEALSARGLAQSGRDDELVHRGSAVEAARRAQAFVMQGELPAEQRERVERLLDELSKEAEHARERTEGLRRDQAMLRRLDRLRLDSAGTNAAGSFDRYELQHHYAEAFREYGVDVRRLESPAIAARIRAGSIRSELITALDDWARHELDGPTRMKVFAAAHELDDDPLRQRLRRSFPRGDLAELRRMAGSDEAVRWPTPSMLMLGLALRASGDPSASVAYFRRAITARPDDFWLRFELAQSLQTLPTPPREEIARHLDVARALRPDSPGALLNYAAALHNLGRYEESAAANRRTLEIAPDYGPAHSNLGLSLLQLGRLDEAEKGLREAVRLQPKVSRRHKDLGWALSQRKDWAGAAESAERAIALDAKNGEAFLLLGDVHFNQGNLERAERAYLEAVRIQPKNAFFHLALGKLRLRRHELVSANACFRRAVELKPDEGEALYYAAATCVSLGDLPAALRFNTTLVRIQPRYSQVRMNLAWCLMESGDLLTAREHAKVAAGTDKNVAGAAQAFLTRIDHLERYSGQLDALRKPDANLVAIGEPWLLAAHCTHRLGAHALSVKLYEHQLVVRGAKGHSAYRFRNAGAGAAVLAASGVGSDAPGDEGERARLRGRALDWMKENLSEWRKQEDSPQGVEREVARIQLDACLSDPRLATVRDELELAKLPDEERKAWEGFWDEARSAQRSFGLPK